MLLMAPFIAMTWCVRVAAGSWSFSLLVTLEKFTLVHLWLGAYWRSVFFWVRHKCTHEPPRFFMCTTSAVCLFELTALVHECKMRNIGIVCSPSTPFALCWWSVCSLFLASRLPYLALPCLHPLANGAWSFLYARLCTRFWLLRLSIPGVHLFVGPFYQFSLLRTPG